MPINVSGQKKADQALSVNERRIEKNIKKFLKGLSVVIILIEVVVSEAYLYIKPSNCAL